MHNILYIIVSDMYILHTVYISIYIYIILDCPQVIFVDCSTIPTK